MAASASWVWQEFGVFHPAREGEAPAETAAKWKNCSGSA
jgi:hypothetical protein